MEPIKHECGIAIVRPGNHAGNTRNGVRITTDVCAAKDRIDAVTIRCDE